LGRDHVIQGTDGHTGDLAKIAARQTTKWWIACLECPFEAASLSTNARFFCGSQ